MKGLCIPLFTRMVMQGVEPYMLDTQVRPMRAKQAGKKRLYSSSPTENLLPY